MPPPNEQRRAQLADAAIELLVESGVHGVTHRAVDRRAGLPAGTASNYFPSREALLVATARRVIEQHQADMAQAAQSAVTPNAAARAGELDGRTLAIELIAGSLLLAAGPHRHRYLAIYELRLESLRRPALSAAIDELMAAMAAFTGDHHAEAGLSIPPAAIPAMLVMYGGALFALVTGPVELVTPEAVRPLAVAVVEGGLAAARDADVSAP
ncbi:TetR/AcrR family transcriptional regulator [Catellatospora citrea]|uniref:TetR family transcriptional regulator n=1 Tax=Catellatospora citrea TaxID=53366 RepID=A0A8J3KMV7_9ACTN|nr:TetR/AcrR family transcriptional regulator [Catellatospora citrea]RKE05240.1 TetR family transcriptional regulator [Catellatospora citrea]GIF98169.1 TetR family transcriptional regulator [Catellatospora citrea]